MSRTRKPFDFPPAAWPGERKEGKMLARICDECGKQIRLGEDVIRLYMAAIDPKTEKPGTIKPVSERDYCESCASGLIAMIRGEKMLSQNKVKAKSTAKKESASKSCGMESGQKSV